MNIKNGFHELKLLLKRPKELVAVVIPIYKTSLSHYERISLSQCIKVLSNYSIIFISPPNLPVDQELNNILKNYHLETFSQEYFLSISGYNRLLLSNEFYERFINYKYILIHQLDAFVFYDDLTYWCNLNIDYIGAPWLNPAWVDSGCFRSGWYYRISKRLGRPYNPNIAKTGNGGFSLRRVRSHLLALYLLKSKIHCWTPNEDGFWSVYVFGYLPFFKVPPYQISIKFAFEVDPKVCYQVNDNNLPFGCHAWWTYDLNFWRPFISKFGYDV
jgi:hypothetical protein